MRQEGTFLHSSEGWAYPTVDPQGQKGGGRGGLTASFQNTYRVYSAASSQKGNLLPLNRQAGSHLLVAARLSDCTARY